MREWRKANKEKKAACNKRWNEQNKAKRGYLTQRKDAKRRGVEFKLSYEEWLEFWGDDLDLRGRDDHQLCMARYGDTGAYEIGNIKKLTMSQNRSEVQY
jgi:hypothetical protein